ASKYPCSGLQRRRERHRRAIPPGISGSSSSSYPLLFRLLVVRSLNAEPLWEPSPQLASADRTRLRLSPFRWDLSETQAGRGHNECDKRSISPNVARD